METYLQVQTTAGNKPDAEKIASTLLLKRLAACVQIVGPITSLYWWEKKQEVSEEFLCIIKTRNELYAQVEMAIQEIHPYDNPEIVATPIVAGSVAYLNWLTEETRQ